MMTTTRLIPQWMNEVIPGAEEELEVVVESLMDSVEVFSS